MRTRSSPIRIRARGAPGQVAGAASYVSGLMRPSSRRGLPDRLLPEPLSRDLPLTHAPGSLGCGGSRDILMPAHHLCGH